MVVSHPHPSFCASIVRDCRFPYCCCCLALHGFAACSLHSGSPRNQKLTCYHCLLKDRHMHHCCSHFMLSLSVCDPVYFSAGFRFCAVLSGIRFCFIAKLHNRASIFYADSKVIGLIPRQFLCQTSGRSPGLWFILRTSSPLSQ